MGSSFDSEPAAISTQEVLIQSDTNRSSHPAPLRANKTPVPRIEVDPEGGFARILFGLWRANRTGKLWIQAAGVETILHFRDGTPVFAERGKLADTLGRLLVRLGRITERDFARAISHVAQHEASGAAVRFGSALVQLGLLNESEVDQALAQQVRQKILSCFEWPTFAAWFDDQPIDPVAVSWTVPKLLAAGCTATLSERQIEQLFEERIAQYAVLTESKATIASLLGLEGADLAIAVAMDGTRTLEHIIEAGNDRLQVGALASILKKLGLLQFNATRSVSSHSIPDLLAAFVLSKPPSVEPVVLSPDEQPTYAPPAPPPNAAVTTPADPPPNADRPTKEVPAKSAPIVRAAKIAVKPVNPSRALPASAQLARGQPTVDAVPTKRAEPPAPPIARPIARVDHSRNAEASTPFNAESSFIAGKSLLETGDFKAARDRFKTALQMSPEALEYKVYLGYARYLACEDPIDHAKFIASARSVALEAIQQDPKLLKAHVILGHLARIDGKIDHAIRHFEHALEINSDDHEANREVRRLTKRREARKKKSFLPDWLKD